MTNILPSAEAAGPDPFFLTDEMLFTPEEELMAEQRVEYIGQLAIPFESYRSYDIKNPDPEVALAEQDAQRAHHKELADYFFAVVEDEGIPQLSVQVLGRILRQMTAQDMSPKTIESVLMQLPEVAIKDKRTIERHMIFLRSVEAAKKHVHGEDYQPTLRDVKTARRSIQQRRNAQITQRLAFAAHGRHVQPQILPDHNNKDQHHDH